jgi:hypothetical protein
VVTANNNMGAAELLRKYLERPAGSGLLGEMVKMAAELLKRRPPGVGLARSSTSADLTTGAVESRFLRADLSRSAVICRLAVVITMSRTSTA